MVIMKHLIILLLSFACIFQANSDEIFKPQTLQELISIHIAQATAEVENRILMVGFESEQKIPTKNRSEEYIIAFNQPLESLIKLKALLKPKGILHVFYMQNESHHWRLVEEIAGEDFTNDILTQNLYLKAVRELNMKEQSINFYKGIAFYGHSAELISEFITKPSLWGIESFQWESKDSLWKPRKLNKGYCFIEKNGEIVIGYYLLEFILSK